MTQLVQNRPNELCPKCGAEYEVLAMLAEHVKGEYPCQCGYMIRTWQGMVEFRYRQVIVNGPAALNLYSDMVCAAAALHTDSSALCQRAT